MWSERLSLCSMSPFCNSSTPSATRQRMISASLCDPSVLFESPPPYPAMRFLTASSACPTFASVAPAGCGTASPARSGSQCVCPGPVSAADRRAVDAVRRTCICSISFFNSCCLGVGLIPSALFFFTNAMYSFCTFTRLLLNNFSSCSSAVFSAELSSPSGFNDGSV